MSRIPLQSDGVHRFAGLVAIVFGILWLTATGLCTATVGVNIVLSSDAPPFEESIGIVLAVSVLSALIGGGIYAIGRWLLPRQP